MYLPKRPSLKKTNLSDDIVHTPAITLLSIGLIVMAGVLLWLGGKQYARRCRLAERAKQRGMEFTRGDSQRLVLSYEDMALLCAGHSRRIENVISGRLGSWSVRAFDFRYDVGHGLRRMRRFYHVVLVDVARWMDSVLMWHVDDLQRAPFLVRQCDQRVGAWLYSGDSGLAERLSHACGALERHGVSMQVHEQWLVLSCPGSRDSDVCSQLLDRAGDIAARLTGTGGTNPAGQPARTTPAT